MPALGLRSWTTWAVLWLGLLLAREARADPALPAVFGDHCVLQQGQPITVWGRADPAERITVRVAGRSATAVTGDDGRWQVELPAVEAGGPHELSVQGHATVRLRDVLVGEVWVCSGQSNMAWPVQAARDAPAEIAAAAHPRIRLFSVPRRAALEAPDDVEANWVACSPATVPGFSAVAYFFGRELHQALEVPVGLVHSSWGGTPAEAWTPDAALRREETLAPLLDQWAQRVADARAKGAKDLTLHPNRPGNLYRGMIAPLVPLTIRGAIWYQGESNAGRAWEYRTLFPVMIRAWRAAWERPDLPFQFVQLANFHPRKPDPGDSAWAELRDAQLYTLRTVDHTGMAVAIDVGEAGDIHPKDKQAVGRRLALWALRAQYGKTVVPSGPLYRDHAIDGAEVTLRFDHVGSGLASRGDVPLEGFTIAGEDRVFHQATARIEGDTVVVSSPEVPSPRAVRYAWADNPACSLVNAEDLPASPFRTDDWRLTTQR